MPETGGFPSAYRDLADRYGLPTTVEHARAVLGAVVSRAEGGTVTLIAPGGPAGAGWAAVVPLSAVAGPAGCPVWTLSAARARLGEVVAAATRFPSPAPQVLARRRQPAAAVVDARALDGLPGDAGRIDLHELLLTGGSVHLEYDPGRPGTCGEDGEPDGAAFVATALGWAGDVIGSGAGPDIAESLLRVRRREPVPPSAAGGVAYSGEPPF